MKWTRSWRIKKERKKETLLVRSRTSILALERQERDQRTSFSQANRTTLRLSFLDRSPVAVVSGSKSSEGGWESELARETDIEVEGVLWSLGLVGAHTETETGLVNTDAICQTLGTQEKKHSALFLSFSFSFSISLFFCVSLGSAYIHVVIICEMRLRLVALRQML